MKGVMITKVRKGPGAESTDRWTARRLKDGRWKGQQNKQGT